MATLLTPPADLLPAEHAEFARVQSEASPLDLARPVAGTGFLRLEGPAAERKHPASYVRGVSLAGVLQMLHLERKTCVLEVTGDDGFGTLTLVNGELVDADVDQLSGQDAACHILAWHEPQTLILDGVSLFRHTIEAPLPQILVEAVRRQDEGASLSGATPAAPQAGSAGRRSDWTWLVETLIISGASCAAVFRPGEDVPLTVADEHGRVLHGAVPERVASFSLVARAARQWSRLLDAEVDQLIVRIRERQVLVQPLAADASCFICAEFDAADSLDLARSAIRSLRR